MDLRDAIAAPADAMQHRADKHNGARREQHAEKQQQAGSRRVKAAEEPGFHASTVARAVRTCMMSTVIEKRKKPPQGINTPRARTWVEP